jgi:ribulose-5-phosphate 4-epimerase/fuculose-1-phosphate aldolase
MSKRFSFGDQNLLVYRFAANSELKSQQIDFFLREFRELCDYRMIDSLDSKADLHQSGAIALFLVSAISNFEVLRNLNCPESTLKIVAYFLTEEEFRQIDVKAFRSPLKSRLYRLIYPDEVNISGLIYASHMKVFDTIYARTLRNKFDSVQIGNNIATYTQLDPESAIADMKEMGWYLRDMGLNHADSFAGGIALRFGEGMLVTASYTDKYQIESERICYVENYTSEKNQVKVVGNFPPSSESALAYLAFQEFLSANLILHFHYKPITSTPKLNYYRTSRYASYGTPAEAEAVVEKLRKTGDFAIAYGHGEFVMAPNFTEAKAVVDKILQRFAYK